MRVVVILLWVLGGWFLARPARAEPVEPAPSSVTADPSVPVATASSPTSPGLLPNAQSDTPRLVVATKVFKPFVMKDDANHLGGFTIELWEAVARQMNVETEYLMTESVGELLAAVAERRADVGAAGITITAERERSVNFSYPYFESGLQIMVKQAPVSSPMVVLKTLFSQGLLNAIAIVLGIVLIVAHIMWLVERHKSPEQFPKSYWRGIWEAFWWSAVTVTTVGYGDKSPVGGLGRIVGLIWMFAGMVLISYFTAAVTTELTIHRLEGSVRGPRDLAGKTVATPHGSTAHQYLLDRGVGPVAVNRIEDAHELLNGGEVDAIVYDAPVLQYHATHEGRGRVATVGSVFHRESYGFALQEGTRLREQVDQAMLALRENGMYYRIYRKWFGGDED